VNLEGKRILVTGGSSGIGLATARKLAAKGALVAICARDEAKLHAAAGAIGAQGAKPYVFRCDVRAEPEVASGIGALATSWGDLDGLVHCAGILRDKALVGVSLKGIQVLGLEEWNEVLQTNLTGTFLVAREVARHLVSRRREGALVLLSSVSAAGNPGQSAYGASKAGVRSLVVTWAQELAPFRIRVVGLAPGLVDTPMTQGFPEGIRKGLEKRIPGGKFGPPEAVADLAVAALENDYLNGRTLEVDGGLRF
jgi:3-oxoacyl-[acyl-carrier protein] reductase